MKTFLRNPLCAGGHFGTVRRYQIWKFFGLTSDHLNSPPTSPTTRVYPAGALPSTEGMWDRSPMPLANDEHRSLDPGRIRPPLQRDGRLLSSRLSEKLGMEKREGGPSKRVAHSVRHEIRATTNIMARARFNLSPSIFPFPL